MLEASIERKFVRYCRRLGVMCIKQNPNWYKNIPDRLVLFPGPSTHYFFLELKRPGKVPNGGQKKFGENLVKRGFPYYWADTFEDAVAILEEERVFS